MSLAFIPPHQRGKNAQGASTMSIQKMLDENNQLIQTIIDYQSKGKGQEVSQYEQMLQRNLVYLAAIADSNQNAMQQAGQPMPLNQMPGPTQPGQMVNSGQQMMAGRPTPQGPMSGPMGGGQMGAAPGMPAPGGAMPPAMNQSGYGSTPTAAASQAMATGQNMQRPPNMGQSQMMTQGAMIGSHGNMPNQYVGTPHRYPKPQSMPSQQEQQQQQQQQPQQSDQQQQQQQMQMMPSTQQQQQQQQQQQSMMQAPMSANAGHPMMGQRNMAPPVSFSKSAQGQQGSYSGGGTQQGHSVTAGGQMSYPGGAGGGQYMGQYPGQQQQQQATSQGYNPQQPQQQQQQQQPQQGYQGNMANNQQKVQGKMTGGPSPQSMQGPSPPQPPYSPQQPNQYPPFNGQQGNFQQPAGGYSQGQYPGGNFPQQQQQFNSYQQQQRMQAPSMGAPQMRPQMGGGGGVQMGGGNSQMGGGAGQPGSAGSGQPGYGRGYMQGQF